MLSERVVLIDAFSQIYRSFYAVRNLSNSRGEPVNALLVFTRLLLGIEKNYPGRRGAMLFDCGKVKFRLDVLPEYKANRPPMPDALAVQIPFIREMASAFGWQMHAVENYEADDLAGAIARNISENVLILSSDKDLSQLINERVTLLTPASGKKSGFEERDASYVKEKYGVLPEQMVEYLALTGDSSDNIDGVPGIGEKSAAELLNTYGASENWIDNPGILAKKFASKLENKGELLRRNIELVKLRTDIPESWSSLDDILEKKAPNWMKIRELCQYYGLKSILKDIPQDSCCCEESNSNTALFEEDELFFTPAAERVDAAVSEKLPEDETPVQGELFTL